MASLTKPQIALDQVRAALRAGVPPAAVLANAGYGIDLPNRARRRVIWREGTNGTPTSRFTDSSSRSAAHFPGPPNTCATRQL